MPFIYLYDLRNKVALNTSHAMKNSWSNSIGLQHKLYNKLFSSSFILSFFLSSHNPWKYIFCEDSSVHILNI